MVSAIQMSCNKHLITVSPNLPRQLDPDLMGKLRGGLSGGEGLVAVVSNDPILFPVEFLDLLHLHFCGTGIAVDTGHKPLNDLLTIPHLWLTGLVLLDGIVNDIGQVAVTGGNGGSFLCVFHIVQNFPNAAMDTPDGCNGHGSALHRHRIKNRRQDFLNGLIKHPYTLIIVLGIDGIQRMSLHGDLVEVVPDVMQLPHHREEVRGRSFFWYNTVDKLPQIGGNGQVAVPCFFLQIPGLCFVQP